mmetsp:Transcript_32302/g.100330  ORF Transcript_32302/g.100330 Transcript_32302/m.100330 type:complete len:427 (-) Transcript_32302:352-1632(-)
MNRAQQCSRPHGPAPNNAGSRGVQGRERVLQLPDLLLSACLPLLVGLTLRALHLQLIDVRIQRLQLLVEVLQVLRRSHAVPCELDLFPVLVLQVLVEGRRLDLRRVHQLLVVILRGGLRHLRLLLQVGEVLHGDLEQADDARADARQLVAPVRALAVSASRSLLRLLAVRLLQHGQGGLQQPLRVLVPLDGEQGLLLLLLPELGGLSPSLRHVLQLALDPLDVRRQLLDLHVGPRDAGAQPLRGLVDVALRPGALRHLRLAPLCLGGLGGVLLRQPRDHLLDQLRHLAEGVLAAGRPHRPRLTPQGHQRHAGRPCGAERVERVAPRDLLQLEEVGRGSGAAVVLLHELLHLLAGHDLGGLLHGENLVVPLARALLVVCPLGLVVCLELAEGVLRRLQQLPRRQQVCLALAGGLLRHRDLLLGHVDR